MQRSEPVLTDPDDIRIWNKIDYVGQEEKRKRRQQDKLSILAVIDDALSTGKQMHSAVLVQILRRAAREQISDLESVAIKVLDMCRPGDMYPVMEAVDIVVRESSTDVTRSLMDRLANVPDTAFMEYLEGMFASRFGDDKGAAKHLIRSNAIDQSFIRTYDVLIAMEPGKGWDVLRNIPLIMAGEKPMEVRTADRDLLELQDIYDGWYNGERGAARKRLESSGGFSSGHMDFLLAAARMTGDVGEYERSLELYDRLLAEYRNIDSIIVEKANILAAMGKRSDCLALLEKLGRNSANNRNVMECMLRVLASKNTEKEFLNYSDRFLRSEHGDKNGHLLVADLMSKIGMNAQADKILRMLVPMFPDDLNIHKATARNEIRLGKDAAALKAADRVIKLSPKTADGYCIRAEIHLSRGRIKNASKDAESALRFNPGSLGSLAVMKGVHIYSKEYEKALEVCRRILILDPDNTDAMKDMAYALDMLGRRDEAAEEYKNALRCRKDPNMLISIISALISGNRSEEAADIAREFMDGSEKIADLWCLRGNAEYHSSDFSGAATSYSKSLDIRPHDPRTWHSRGMAEEMAGMYREAESSYDRAVIMDLDNPEFWLSKAIVQEKKGDLKGAVLSLNRVISDSPENVFALVRKSKILMYAGRPKEALFFLDQALKIDWKNIRIMQMKKNIHKRAESYDKVIDVCKDILRADKNNIDALTDMAETYQKMGKHDEALKVLSNVSSDLGEVGVLIMKKNSARLNDNIEVEIDACISILKIEPDNRSVKLDLADALIRNGDHDDAMKVYDDIQESDPKDAEVIILRGKLRSMMGDESSAVALYHEAVLEDPDNSDTLNELASALCDSKEYKEALSMISRAIEISPEAPKCHLTRCRIFLAMNDTKGALESLTGALEDVAEKGVIYMRIGGIYESRGDLDDALTAYDSAIRDGIDGGDAHYRRGKILELLGNREAAKKSYSAAAMNDGHLVRALERLGTMQLDDNELASAKKSLDSALAADPFDSPSLLSRARLYVKEGNSDKAIPIYRTLSSRDDSTAEMENELKGLLKDTEPPAETVIKEESVIRKDAPEEKNAADIGSTYDLALLALEHAYATGSAISDDRMLSSLGIKGAKRDAVLKYLSDFEEYGDIDVRSKEFERMERLSKNVILAENIDDIDSNPLIGIPAAFIVSKAETIDDAKKLIAYVYKAITDESDAIPFSDDVRDAVAEASEMSGDITTYGLMRMFNVGVYTARTIGRLAKMDRKKGIDMHI